MSAEPTTGPNVHRRCGECGCEMAKAHKVHAGTPLCQACYQRLFKRRTCAKCGEGVRALAQDPEPICPACRRKDRACLRCERPVPIAALMFKGKAVCASCAPYFSEPRSCPRCGKTATRLSRVVGVTEEQVCDTCRRSLVCATCSICGKHRERFALSSDGKPVCKACAAAPDATHFCPDCGISLGGSGSAPCRPCSLVRSTRKKALALTGILESDEAKRLLLEFVDWVVARKAVGKVLGRLPTVAEMIGRVERAIPEGGTLTSAAIDAALTTEEIRRAGLFGMFLAECGLVSGSDKVRAAASDARRIRTALSDTRGKPWGKLIQEYADELAKASSKLSLRSQRLYLRAAIELMGHSDIDRIADLSDADIRKFLRSKPGHRASLSRWISFVSSKTGLELSLCKRFSARAPTIRAAAEEVDALATAIRSSSSKRARGAMLAKLLSVLYGVPLEHVLAMDQADLDLSKGRSRIRFETDWVAMESLVADIVLDVLAEGASDVESLKLFPGRMVGDTLSSGAVQYHLENSRGV